MSYHGPVVVLSLDDARTVLSYITGKPDTGHVQAKLLAAIMADPKWREPLP